LKSELFDIRTPMWREAFSRAVPFADYLESGDAGQKGRWLSHRERVTLSDLQRSLLASFTRRMNVLVLSGIWCGDCSRQGPILAAIGEAASVIDVRFLDNQAMPGVRDELRIHGASRVPIAVTLSEDLFEVGRSGDRTLSVYRRKAMNEFGAACDSGIVLPKLDESAQEVAEWIEHLERHQLLLRLSPFLRARHND
jgi:hypothetical protein